MKLQDADLDDALKQLAPVGSSIVIASHPRSGAHLITDVLRRQFKHCRPKTRPLESIHDSFLAADRFAPDALRPIELRQAIKILKKARRPTVTLHATPDLAAIRMDRRPFVRALLDRSDLVYCVRDGRSTMASLYTWMRCFREEADVPFGEFLRQRDSEGRSRPEAWAEHVRAWLSLGSKLTVIKFEDTLRDPERAVARLARKLRLKALLAKPIIPRPLTTRTGLQMARLAGRRPPEDAPTRGQPTPRPEELFTDADTDFFKRHAGQMMDHLGYTL